MEHAIVPLQLSADKSGRKEGRKEGKKERKKERKKDSPNMKPYHVFLFLDFIYQSPLSAEWGL